MNTKETKKRQKRKCCPFICCTAVEYDVVTQVTQGSRLPPFRKLAGRASMALQECLSEFDDVSSEDSFVEEATTVLTEDQTQNQPLPTEKPSNAPTSSAAIPKRKTFFSRVSAAFCRIFRKGAKTSS
ncbi:hypothetical protein AOLI_G00219350 [Acnodon oligacanthus]